MIEGTSDRAGRRVGTTIKQKYRLERLLGTGGMACVYRATHRNGHRVALKMLHPEVSVDADIRTRFLREGYVANKVDHPGSVRILDDDVAEDGAVFLVMELLEGETLADRWERSQKKLPPELVLSVASQLLDVLAAAHAKSIVHRDIKPENIFLTGTGAVKVLDFGIARLREPTVTHTRTGRMMGTPAFMPPEQARGKKNEIDGQTDVWAVGATMFALLSGRYVHEGAETVEELVIFTATKPAPPLGSVAPEVAPAIAAVVDKALAFEKQNRWASAVAMRDAVAAANQTAFGRTIILPSGAVTAVQAGDSEGPSGHPMVGADSTIHAGDTPATGFAESAGNRPSTTGGTTGDRLSARRSRRGWAWIAGALAAVAGIAIVASVVGRGSPSVTSAAASGVIAEARATVSSAPAAAVSLSPPPPMGSEFVPAASVSVTAPAASAPRATLSVSTVKPRPPARPQAAPTPSRAPAPARDCTPYVNQDGIKVHPCAD